MCNVTSLPREETRAPRIRGLVRPRCNLTVHTKSVLLKLHVTAHMWPTTYYPTWSSISGPHHGRLLSNWFAEFNKFILPIFHCIFLDRHSGTRLRHYTQEAGPPLHNMSKPMKPSSEAGSLSQQQTTDQKKPCDTCCDLNPLCSVEPSTTKRISISEDNRCITLYQTLGAFKASEELGCPICGLLAAVLDQFWPTRTLDAEVTLELEENTPPILFDSDDLLSSVSLYTSTRLGKCALSTQRWRSIARRTLCY